MSLNFNKKDVIFLAGHRGLVGSSIYKLLKKKYSNIIIAPKNKLNLINQDQVRIFLKKNKVDIIIIAAAKVGGINANQTKPVEFLYNNTMINMNIIHSAYENNIKKIIYLGSSCIYPRNSKQPIKEEYLLNSSLEKTNEAYALAKISGLKLCHYYNINYNTSYRCLMPTNIYGKNDNFDTEFGHVIPSLIAKFKNAKKFNKHVTVWGNGLAKREFLHVDDLAESVLFLMKLSHKDFMKYSFQSYFNVGSGEEISIKNLIILLKKIFKFNPKINYDKNKPNGTLRKKLNSNRLRKLGWRPKIKLIDGLKEIIQ